MTPIAPSFRMGFLLYRNYAGSGDYDIPRHMVMITVYPVKVNILLPGILLHVAE